MDTLAATSLVFRLMWKESFGTSSSRTKLSGAFIALQFIADVRCRVIGETFGEEAVLKRLGDEREAS